MKNARVATLIFLLVFSGGAAFAQDDAPVQAEEQPAVEMPEEGPQLSPSSSRERPQLSDLPSREGDDDAEPEGGGTEEQKVLTPAGRWFSKFVFSFGCSILVLREDYGLESAPTPVLPAPAFALAFPPLGGGSFKVGLETTLDMYFTHYKWSYAMNCPLPAEIENRSAFVFGPILAFQVQAGYAIKKMRFRLSGGIAGDLRIVAIAEDLNARDMEDATAQTENIKNYFWEGARWVFPLAGLGADFQITPKYSVGLDLRFWFPLDVPEAAANTVLGAYRFAVGVKISRNWESR